MRRISMGLLAVLVFLASCSTKPVIPNSSAAAIGAHAMDQWIDPAIQGKEREIIRREIANVPAEERENFTFVDLDRNVYVNRPEIRGDLEWLHPTGDEGVYVDSAGNKRFFAAPLAKPSDADLEAQYTTSKNYDGCPVNRGAYRRVMTKEGCASGGRCSGKVYTRMLTDVTVFGKNNTIKVNKDRETAYVTFNMWGTKYVVNGQQQYPVIDANLQYDPTSFSQDWAMTMSYYSLGTGRRETPEADRMSYNSRFASNQVIHVGLTVSANNRIQFYGQGKRRTDGRVIGFSIIMAVRGGFPFSGRSSDGSGINIGHNIAIAQESSDWRATGAYFKGTEIRNVRVGYLSKNASGNFVDNIHPFTVGEKAIECVRGKSITRNATGGIDIILPNTSPWP